ncbi:MAG: LamG domain-containing protein [Gammaproteobacteria bacterium]|nr:LamG domain-containing protein [Gammaproteobacteria bacterium]
MAPLNQWNHMVSTVNPARVKIHLNNELVGDCPIQNNWFATNAPVEIGRNNYDGKFITGSMDDVKIYTGILTPEEVTQLFSE